MTSFLTTEDGNFLVTEAGDFLWFEPSDVTVKSASAVERQAANRILNATSNEVLLKVRGIFSSCVSSIGTLRQQVRSAISVQTVWPSVKMPSVIESLLRVSIRVTSAEAPMSASRPKMASAAENLSAIREMFGIALDRKTVARVTNGSAIEPLLDVDLQTQTAAESLSDNKRIIIVTNERLLNVRQRPPSSSATIGPVRVLIRSGFWFQSIMVSVFRGSPIERLLRVSKSTRDFIDILSRSAGRSPTPVSWYGVLRNLGQSPLQALAAVRVRVLAHAEWATPMSMRAVAAIERLFRQRMKAQSSPEIVPMVRGRLRAMLEFRGSARNIQPELTEHLLDARGFAVTGSSTQGRLRALVRIMADWLALLPPTKARMPLEIGETVMFSAPARIPLDWRLDVRGRLTAPIDRTAALRIAQKSLIERLTGVRRTISVPVELKTAFTTHAATSAEHLAKDRIRALSSADLLGHVLARASSPVNFNGAVVWKASGSIEHLVRVMEKQRESAELLLDVRAIAKAPEFFVGPIRALMRTHADWRYPVSFKHAQAVEILLTVRDIENMPVVWHGYGLVQKPRLQGTKTQIILEGEID